MNGRLVLASLTAALTACSSTPGGETLSSLREVKPEIKEEYIEGGLEKAIESYRQFLAATPESAMTPEAIRRLADLKVEREYGLIGGAAQRQAGARLVATAAPEPAPAVKPVVQRVASTPPQRESDEEFEARAAAADSLQRPSVLVGNTEAEQRANALEAIALYQRLLTEYPHYERNDQVLYQMARVYEELGEIETAMQIMDRMVVQFPRSVYIDEVQFRRGEYFFTRQRYLDAEEAYQAVTELGVGSAFYELALYKLGWSLYKQELYEEGLHSFIGLLDHHAAAGVDFARIDSDLERQRIDDTFRVISFSFSYLGGPEAVDDYFHRYGERAFEEHVYSNLGEHYLEKRRYSDAAQAYQAFVRRYPFHRSSPRFDMRVIEIYKEGGFPRLVIDANKAFARKYGLRSEYWQHFQVESFPEVLGYLKQTLKELANHYHSLYQDEHLAEAKPENFHEARLWYREYLSSFPRDADSPPINYQLADLLLENKNYAEAAREYERTAYDYQPHEQMSAAAYAAVYAYRQHLNSRPEEEKDAARREVVRASLRFGDTFPEHADAPTVLGGAAADLYEMQDYAQAVEVGRRVIASYPEAESDTLRSAWLVVAHASFDLQRFEDAEQGYAQVLERTVADAEDRDELYENLAAAIYKQGEQAVAAEDYETAAYHFLRLALHAPNSRIRPTAEFDGAVALIQLKAWDRAAEVLRAFRRDFPGHPLQPEVTKRIALVYKESGQLVLAASEYERIEQETDDEQVRREALLIAAELYEEGGEPRRAIQAYTRYLQHFPRPLEPALDARYRLASVYQSLGDQTNYHRQLRLIVDADARAGKARTDRTRHLAATSALVITEPLYQRLVDIHLVQPFEQNLRRKQQAMQAALDAFGKLTEYRIGESTAAATYYIAEIYGHFSTALMESERPANLSPLELEEYELLLEEQAYPFEERAIEVHIKNLELMSVGVFNQWIEKSLARLAELMPARYAKPEESTGFVTSVGAYRYDIVRPEPEPADAAPDAVAEEPERSEAGEAGDAAHQGEGSE